MTYGTPPGWRFRIGGGRTRSIRPARTRTASRRPWRRPWPAWTAGSRTTTRTGAVPGLRGDLTTPARTTQTARRAGTAQAAPVAPVALPTPAGNLPPATFLESRAVVAQRTAGPGPG